MRERISTILAIEHCGDLSRRDSEKTMVTANEVRPQCTTLVFDRSSGTKVAREYKSRVTYVNFEALMVYWNVLGPFDREPKQSKVP